MPSIESQELGRLYESKASRMKANRNLDRATILSLYEEEQSCAAEAPDITYEDVKVRGRQGIWASPVGLLPQSNDNQPSVIMYIHGGGFSLGSPNSHRKLAAHLGRAAKANVLILNYRLAPEHPFPAALDDLLAAYEWLLQERGLPASKIATAGDSAGGNLATALVLRIMQEETGRLALPAAIVAFSPWYNLENNFGSMSKNDAFDKLVHRPQLDQLARAYVAGIGASLRDPLINPIYADLQGLPPIYIAVGTHETLQDDSVRFAELARKAGVEVELEMADEQQHVHVFMAGRAIEADVTIQNVGRWLQQRFSSI
jgi:acetyl esterase/lipase